MLLIAPVLAAVIGLLVYALSVNPKVAELGRLAFGCGLLVALFVFAQHGVRVLP